MGRPGATASSTGQGSRNAYERAVACLRASDPQGAERILRTALAKYPGDANLRCLLGAALLQQRRPREAEACLAEAISLAPGFARAYEGRADALIAQQRLAESLADLQRARALAPAKASVLLKLGQVHIALGQDAEAADVLVALLNLHPDSVDVLLLLAGTFDRLRRSAAAEAALERATALAPASFQAWMDLGVIQQRRDRLQAAEASFRRAAELRTELAAPQVALGMVQALAGRHEEALASFRRALELEAGNADALAGMGHVLKTLGDRDAAVEAYRACIAHHPGDGQAYWALADFKTFRFEDRDLEAMQAQLDSPELAPLDRIGLLFALGMALDRRGQFDAAMTCFNEGNQLKRRTVRHDPGKVARLHESLREVFTADFLAAHAGSGCPDDAPIFIVGMPRSGSTLVEQILASHSLVDGTYELPELDRVARSIGHGRSGGPTWPASIRQLQGDEFDAQGRRYLELTRIHRGSSPRFTDKMPNNFVHIGLLALILPNARIINVRRNPLDTCLSCYMQLFAQGQSFSYDLAELGQHYLQYHRLMEYWHEVLPGRVLDVQYEDVIADLEGQVRRLLEYCGLPWDDACVRYHQSERVIRSASSEQVRLPLYRDAQDRWRPYAEHLSPLVEALGPLAGGMTGPSTR